MGTGEVVGVVIVEVIEMGEGMVVKVIAVVGKSLKPKYILA